MSGIADGQVVEGAETNADNGNEAVAKDFVDDAPYRKRQAVTK